MVAEPAIGRALESLRTKLRRMLNASDCAGGSRKRLPSYGRCNVRSPASLGRILMGAADRHTGFDLGERRVSTFSTADEYEEGFGLGNRSHFTASRCALVRSERGD